MDSKKTKSSSVSRMIFVLGGPGTSRSAHAEKMAQDFGFRRINVDELLQEEMKNVHKRYYTKFT